MIIPVRCFTCGKVHGKALVSQLSASGICLFSCMQALQNATSEASAAGCQLQVVGNKWDTYLELLQLEYSEG